jgi:hypothetical protein
VSSIIENRAVYRIPLEIALVVVAAGLDYGAIGAALYGEVGGQFGWGFLSVQSCDGGLSLAGQFFSIKVS